MQGGKGLIARTAAIIALVGSTTAAVPAQAQLSKGNGDLRVMTYNVDEGTDFNEVVAAQTLTEFLLAVGETITQVRATDLPSRMQAVAQQPTLVSLQELDQWSTGPFDQTTQTCGAVTTEFDMAQELTNALAAGGAAYTIAYEAIQVHIPPIPDPEYAGKTKRGGMADILTQLDGFTGRILDELDALGISGDTIVVWISDNGADPNYRLPAGDPDPFGGQWDGFSGPWRGGYFTSLEGSNRTPCIIRWPGKTPAGKVSNELVHQVDLFTTLLLAGGANVPTDRQIDGVDMRDFLLGDASESGREAILCLQGNRLQAIKWRQWKVHLFHQDDSLSTWTPYNAPHIHNLEWDPREEHQVDFPHGWVLHPMAAAAGAFLKSLTAEPPIKPGTPDPYTPPKPGELRAEEHLQVGAITQYVTSLVRSHDELPTPHHGLDLASG